MSKLIQFKELKIDFDHLEKLDNLQVVQDTPEDSKAFTEFLKAYRQKKPEAKRRGQYHLVLPRRHGIRRRRSRTSLNRKDEK